MKTNQISMFTILYQVHLFQQLVKTRRVSKNLQQGRSGGEGTGYRGYITNQKKTRSMAQPQSSVFLGKSFLGQVTRWGRNQ